MTTTAGCLRLRNNRIHRHIIRPTTPTMATTTIERRRSMNTIILIYRQLRINIIRSTMIISIVIMALRRRNHSSSNNNKWVSAIPSHLRT